jgi:hypothetical protein
VSYEETYVDDDFDDELEDAEEWREGECDNCSGGDENGVTATGPLGDLYCACRIGQGAPEDECRCGDEDRERINIMSERVTVRVLLLFGDQAEIVGDVAPEEQAEPVRYPAVEIAEAVGAEVKDLPGMRLTAEVGPGDRLQGWQLP